MGTELLLPLREVCSLDGWDGVLLLPLGEVVGIGLWVDTKHECLHTEDVVGNERSLEESLRDNVIRRE